MLRLFANRLNLKRWSICKLIALCLSIWITGFLVQAQDLTISMPQKVPTKVSEYEIIGKTNEGILVRKWGYKYNELEAYGLYDLKVKWTKEMEFEDKKAKVIEIIPYASEILIFYTVKNKRITSLYARRSTPDLRYLGKDVLLDTIEQTFGGQGFDYFVEKSLNKEHVSILRYNYDFSGLRSINGIVFDKELATIHRQSFGIEEKAEVKTTFLTNEGKLYIAIVKNERPTTSNKQQFDIVNLVEYNPQTDKKNMVVINKSEEFYLNDIKIKPDNKNQHIVLAGFYAEKQRTDVSNGYFYIFVDMKTKMVSQQYFNHFSDHIFPKINANNRLVKNKRVYNLEVKDLLLRNDGGALLVGETYHTAEQNATRSTFDSYYSRQERQLLSHYHEDIVLLSINPDGSLLWDNVLKKKQFSEDDDGYFASFGIFNGSQNLNLIFNEEVSYRTNVNSYVLTSSGDYKVANLLNVREYSMMMAPRYGKQLSRQEILIPCFNNRNEFILTKITFN
ncbi:MAG: hypothetical protein ACPGXL_01085 [Chitinophagales bacterium]